MATATRARPRAHAPKSSSPFDALIAGARPGEPEVVDVPAARFLTVDGSGSPDTQAFKDAISALYSLAYTARFALKRQGGPAVKVPPLEGLYDVPGVEPGLFTVQARERLSWTLMIRLPEEIDDALVERSRAEAARKKKLPALANVRVTELHEGRCVQVLHRGPYATEDATMAALHELMKVRGLKPAGRHHEIYLSVPGLTKPENMKTLLRQPVR